MKKIISLILCIFMLFLTACNNKDVIIEENNEFKEQIYTLELDKTYKWELNGNGTTIKLNSDNTVESSSWGNDTGVTEYAGTFEIKDNTLIISLGEYYDLIEWTVLPNDHITVYEITNENEFKTTYNEIEQIYNLNN